VEILPKTGKGGNRYGISFKIASRLNQQENQIRVATFITCIGSDALEVYNSLPFEREDDNMVMSKVLELMEKHGIG